MRLTRPQQAKLDIGYALQDINMKQHASKAVSGSYSSAGVITANSGDILFGTPRWQFKVQENAITRTGVVSYPSFEVPNSNQYLQSHRHRYLSLKIGLAQL